MVGRGGDMQCRKPNAMQIRAMAGNNPLCVDVGRSDGGARNEARYVYLKEVFSSTLPPTQR
jgi:hypothetical protein